MNSIVVIVVFILCCIASFIGGCLFKHASMVVRQSDGKLIVKKATDDEIMTLFELNIKPEDLLTKTSFYLKVIHKD